MTFTRKLLVALLPALAFVADATAARYPFDGANLFVDIDAAYPEGAKPSWDFVTKVQQVPLNVAGTTQLRRMTAGFGNFSGRSGLIFRVDGVGGACVADVTPGPGPVLITAKPQTFELGNFRQQGAGGTCATSGGRNARTWSGRLTMAAAPDGNITMDVALEAAPEGRDKGWMLVATGIAVKNRLTPAMLAANAERNAEAAAQREAQRLAALKAMELPEPDLTPLEASAKPVAKLQVQLSEVDDIGFVLIGNAEGKWKGVAPAEWNAGNEGAATENLGPQLQTGDNYVVFVLHNKQFAFGPGKWSYHFSLVADNNVAWTRAERVGGGSVGIRYWKPFIVTKAKNGRLAFSAATAEQTAPIVERMKGFNKSLIREFGQETSMGAMVMGAAVNSMFGASSGSGSSGGSGGCNADCQNEQIQNRDRADRERYQRPPDPAPVTPIGGAGGFYGCAAPPCM